MLSDSRQMECVMEYCSFLCTFTSTVSETTNNLQLFCCFFLTKMWIDLDEVEKESIWFRYHQWSYFMLRACNLFIQCKHNAHVLHRNQTDLKNTINIPLNNIHNSLHISCTECTTQVIPVPCFWLGPIKMNNELILDKIKKFVDIKKNQLKC